MTDTYRIVGLAGRGAVPADDGSGDRNEPFLVDLALHARAEIDLAAAASAAAEAIEHARTSLLARAESVAAAVRAAVDVESVEVTLHRPEVALGVPVLEVEVSIVRPVEPEPAISTPVIAAPAAASAPEPEPPAALAVPALAAPALAAEPPNDTSSDETPAEELPAIDLPEADHAEADLPEADLDATTVRAVPSPARVSTPESDDDAPAAATHPRRPSSEAPLPALLVLSGRGAGAQHEMAGAARAVGTAAGIDVTGVSPLARTTTGGGELHSAVVAVSTTLGPGDLAEAAALVAAGRTGIDVEILALGDLVGVYDGVELPLPAVASSATVLVPWSHLDPNAVLPGLGGGPVVVLAETAPDRDQVRWLALDWLE